MRRLRIALAPLVLTLALTGCGDSGSSTSSDSLSPTAVFAQVAAKTQEAGSSKFVLTTTIEAEGEKTTFGGEGAFAADGSKGSIVLGLPGGLGDVEVRLLDGQAYLKLPGQEGWLATPIDKLAGSSFGTSADPTSALDQLAAASSELKETGTETTRGTECTVYTGVFDYDKAAAAATGPGKAQIEKALAGLSDKTVPFTALVDAEGRMRKFTQDLTVEQGGQTGAAELVLEFFDFGTAIDVEAPPADQITKDSPLLDQILSA